MLRLTTPVDKNVRWKLPTKLLQVEQPLVEVMSKDHERMIRGCFANGSDSYQTKRCDIFNGKNIYRKGSFLMETL